MNYNKLRRLHLHKYIFKSIFIHCIHIMMCYSVKMSHKSLLLLVVGWELKQSERCPPSPQNSTSSSSSSVKADACHTVGSRKMSQRSSRLNARNCFHFFFCNFFCSLNYLQSYELTILILLRPVETN